jgi:hypothetical protein
MIAEVTRIVEAWYGDGTHGLNALLAVVPLDGSDTRPTNIAAIVTDLTNGDVARGGLPLDSDFPSVAISSELVEQITMDAVSGEAEAFVKVRVKIAVDNPDTDGATLAMSYYLRISQRALRTLCRDAGANYSTNRTRNSSTIYVESYEAGTEAIETPVGDSKGAYVIGHFVATLRVRDRWKPTI